MGHRASYAIKENGAVSYYYSHWGAKRIQADFFFGPEPTLELIRATRKDERLLTDVWGEGGACIDLDTKHLLVFGSAEIEASVRNLWLEMLPFAWRGWTTCWANYGMVSLADYLQVPMEEVLESEPISDEYIQISDETKVVDLNDPDHWIDTVISIKSLDGNILDVVSDHLPDFLLASGEIALINYLRRCPLYSPEKQKAPCCLSSIYMDIKQKKIIANIGNRDTIDYTLEKALKLAWPGWDFQGHCQDLEYHWSISGRDASFLSVPLDKLISRLRGIVVSTNEIDPHELISKIEESGSTTSSVNPYFFDTYSLNLDQAKRQQFFDHVVAQWRDKTRRLP